MPDKKFITRKREPTSQTDTKSATLNKTEQNRLQSLIHEIGQGGSDEELQQKAAVVLTALRDTRLNSLMKTETGRLLYKKCLELTRHSRWGETAFSATQMQALKSAQDLLT